VLNHNNIQKTEYIVHGRHGLESEGGASTGVSLGKKCSCGANPIAGFVQNVFPGIDFVAKIPGDSLRDFGRAGVKAVDHQCLHRDGLVGAFEGVHIESGLFSVLVIAELAHFHFPGCI